MDNTLVLLVLLVVLPLVNHPGKVATGPPNLVFLKLVEWAKEYGQIYLYSMAGQPIVVLDGVKAATDILDRLSAQTADGPRLIKLSHYLCGDLDFGCLPRNNTKYRRAVHEGHRVSKEYRHIQEEETRTLVKGIFLHPEIDAVKHLHRHSCSPGWREIFGHETNPLEGPDPSAPMEEVNRALFLSTIPGVILRSRDGGKPILQHEDERDRNADWYGWPARLRLGGRNSFVSKTYPFMQGDSEQIDSLAAQDTRRDGVARPAEFGMGIGIGFVPRLDDRGERMKASAGYGLQC
ncbi:hypothetical protein CALCODRAFT_506164 [Calocera cornea HHB12733]|uniref:Uncharacterized protein n=1 Tax=Calocera cornea HHB12733 TaxID=1353952 RepID=A0A165JB41_9BASI|nr:hypothetical protein CALCODRAFT_506164 [Calocera cornea HHB12733]